MPGNRLLTKGETAVTAVDYSPRMIEIAKKRTPKDIRLNFTWEIVRS
ncbi:MAG TPA: class I SAM-dependent methyltransferase [Bacillaceae bacterium]